MRERSKAASISRGDEMKLFKGPFNFNLLLVSLIFVFTLVAMAQHAEAGKYPYAEFLPTLAHETREILKKHGLPVADNRENPWFYDAGIPGSYTLYFYQADEIPQQAELDIIKLCMDFYVQRGRKERFRIVMYRESADEWRKSLFFGVATLTTMKPFFELTIKGEE